MYSFDELLHKNLPVCVRVENLHQVNISWPQQMALFVMTTTACLSGIMALSYYTYRLELHDLKPLGMDLDPMLMVLNLFLFMAAVGALALWFHSDHSVKVSTQLPKTEDLNYIFPQSHSLHIGPQAWDLNEAHAIILDYPNRVVVEFRSPHKTFILLDDRSGYPAQKLSAKTRRQLDRNAALFVYLSGVDLPDRYTQVSNWQWNIGAGFLFVVSTTLPFLFQAMGFTLYWISFLAIPLSYLIFKVGQSEFQRRVPFTYSEFLAKHGKRLDTTLYRPPLI